jgi:hypothetical protein
MELHSESSRVDPHSMRPNKPDAADPAITVQTHAGHQWRGVADLRRSAA